LLAHNRDRDMPYSTSLPAHHLA